MTQRPIATVFGGTGFLGHAVVQRLAVQGYQVRVPTRSLEKAKELKVMGAVGQIVPFRASVRTDSSVLAALAGSCLVVNLLGQAVESKGNSFQTLHVEVAARIARLAKSASVGRLVHISAAGADTDSDTAFFRTKASGEAAVRAFFSNATLFRPNLLYGPRDRFLNKLNILLRYTPWRPRFSGGDVFFRPLYVGDLAEAIVSAAKDPLTASTCFDASGPEAYSLHELIDIHASFFPRTRLGAKVPRGVMLAIALLSGLCAPQFFSTGHLDLLKGQWAQKDPAAKSLKMLGLSPCDIKAWLQKDRIVQEKGLLTG